MTCTYDDAAPKVLIESDMQHNTDGSRKDLFPVLTFRSSGVQLSTVKLHVLPLAWKFLSLEGVVRGQGAVADIYLGRNRT